MKKILLVEDDPLMVKIYTTRFKKAGLELESVSDGENAISRLKGENFDLLILDLVLPRLTGFEILEKIRGDEKLKDLKVVILSNLDQKTDVKKANELKVARYLIKAHYKPSEVVEEILKVLEE
jgi:two-component system alkaline phosphatase synthesis response regulator PhoP